MSRTLHAIVGLLLLTAPAGLGVATYSDQVTVPYLESSGANETEGEVVDSFEATFDEPIETGRLDLRVDYGKVKVVAWEKNAYEVEVLQVPTDDDRTQVEFTDDSEGSTLDLSVVVDRQQQSGAHVDAGEQEYGDDHVDKAIVARVPAGATYEDVYACEGQASAVSQAIDDGFSNLPGVEESDEDRGCVPAGDQPETRGSIQVDADDDDRHLNLTWGAIGLDGEKLEMRVDYGDIVLEQLNVETAKVVTDYGDLSGEHVTAKEAQLVTDYGDVSIADLDADHLQAVSDYGDLDLDGSVDDLDVTTSYGDVRLTGTVERGNVTTDYGKITVNGTFDAGRVTTDYGDVVMRLQPTDTGAIDVYSDNGAVSVFVPEGDAYGYDVSAATDHGDVVIGLEGASTEGGNASANDEEGGEDDGETVHAKTNDFEEREVQLTLDLDTDYGDIWVTGPDEEVQDDPDDEDDGGSGGSGSSSGTASPVQPGTLVR